MEFAEWVVAGLDQLRLGQLPAGNDFYTAVSTVLGGDPRLAGYMSGGDPAARAELVQLVAAAVAANPGAAQHLQAAAASAQGAAAGAADSGRPPFLKTTNGLLAIVAAAVVVVGGGIGLAVSLGGGGGGGDVAGILKGTWTCHASGAGAGDIGSGPLSFTVGDGTWTAGSASGTWKQNGSSATLHDTNEPTNDVTANGLPSGTGSFDLTMDPANDRAHMVSVHIKGTLATHRLTLALPSDSGALELTCTK